MSLNLLYAEVFKIGKRPSLGIFALSACSFVFFAPLVIAVLAYSSPDAYLDWAMMAVRYPADINFFVAVFYYVGPFVAAVVGGMVIGQEYGDNTWKMVLPRTGSRASLVNAKAIGIVAYLWVTFAGCLTFFLVGSAIAESFLGISIPAQYRSVSASQIAAVALLLVPLALYGLAAAAGAFAFRSASAGVMIGVLAPVVSKLVEFPLVSWALPTPLLDCALATIQHDSYALEKLTAVFGRPVPLGYSLSALVVYVVAIHVLCVFVFRAQDMGAS